MKMNIIDRKNRRIFAIILAFMMACLPSGQAKAAGPYVIDFSGAPTSPAITINGVAAYSFQESSKEVFYAAPGDTITIGDASFEGIPSIKYSNSFFTPTDITTYLNSSSGRGTFDAASKSFVLPNADSFTNSAADSSVDAWKVLITRNASNKVTDIECDKDNSNLTLKIEYIDAETGQKIHTKNPTVLYCQPSGSTPPMSPYTQYLVNDAAKSGRTFIQWDNGVGERITGIHVSSDGVFGIDENGALSVTIGRWGVNGAYRVFARFSASTPSVQTVSATRYTVSFDANGGTGTMASATVEEYSDYNAPACGFTAPKGLVFGGWEVGSMTYMPGEAVKITRTTTMKAIWEDEKGYTITYDKNIENLRKLLNDTTATVNGDTRSFVNQRAKDMVSMLPYESPVKGCEMLGWAYKPDSIKPDIEIDPSDKTKQYSVANVLSGLRSKGIEVNDGLITLYAVWSVKEYKITYVGIDSKNLPATYNSFETLVLPTAKEVNAGTIDSEYSKDKVFRCWSYDQNKLKEVRSLGKNGKITSGDVTLYPFEKMKSDETVAETDEYATEQNDKGIKAVLIKNKLNLLNRDDYAVVYFEGTNTSIDPDSITLQNNDWYEICDVGEDRVKLGHGYATIGIRAKDKVTYDNYKEATKSGPKKLNFRVKTTNGNEHSVTLNLSTTMTLPSFALKTSTFCLFNGEDATGDICTKIKDISKLMPYDSGEWEVDFVRGKKNNNSLSSSASVSMDEDFKIHIVANEDFKDGLVRLRNTSWIPGAYIYAPLKVILCDRQKTKINLTKNTLVLNNTFDKDSDSTRITLSDGSVPKEGDGLTIKWKNEYGEGLTYEIDDDGVLTVTSDYGLPRKTYILELEYNAAGKTIKNKINVKVVNTDSSKVANLTVKGKIDAYIGGTVYLIPNVNNAGGDVVSAAVTGGAASVSEFDASYENGYVVLRTTDDYKPGKDNRNVSVQLTLSSGNVVCVNNIKFTPTKGTFAAKLLGNTYDRARAAELSTDEEPYALKLPLVATYVYTYNFSPTVSEKRLFTLDMTTEEANKMYVINELKCSKKDGFSISYKDGFVSVTETKKTGNKKITITPKGEFVPAQNIKYVKNATVKLN